MLLLLLLLLAYSFVMPSTAYAVVSSKAVARLSSTVGESRPEGYRVWIRCTEACGKRIDR